MAASEKLTHFSIPLKRIPAKHGVLTLYGYGIQVRVDRGHLILNDGIGPERSEFRLPRVGHGLERLIVIGNDGSVSLAALRWLADQNAAFVMLERDGKVVCVTGPVRPSDARLRRAQALAHQSGDALKIARELISKKIAGQEKVVREKLRNADVAMQIVRISSELAEAETISQVRLIESQAAAAYWAAWRDLPILFPKNDLQRTPEHWRTFGTRQSELTGSCRLATNPVNAMLNYLYAVLESESRLALSALGLDPGLGFIHVDTPARDSLACDLMEAVRPKVDSYVLDWVSRNMLKREWYFEMPDGNCRLSSSLAIRLSETSRMWAHAVAPMAEWITRTLWSRKPNRETPPTRLTQQNKREAKGYQSFRKGEELPKPQLICRDCGKTLERDASHKCKECFVSDATENMVDVAQIGRETSLSASAQAKRAKTQSRQATARWAWKPEHQPIWLTERFYLEKIQPTLASTSTSLIARTLGVARCYAARIKQGRVPHPRHWRALAKMAGVNGNDPKQ
jgi:CRISPR-associated endonuclease Cas1